MQFLDHHVTVFGSHSNKSTGKILNMSNVTNVKLSLTLYVIFLLVYNPVYCRLQTLNILVNIY